MMNLFENLQLMHEAEESNNDIIKVKISGCAPSSEGSTEEEKEYQEFVKNDYNLDVVKYGDISPEIGYEIVQGSKEDIENYLSEIYGFDFDDDEVEVLSPIKIASKNNSKYKNYDEAKLDEESKAIVLEMNKIMEANNYEPKATKGHIVTWVTIKRNEAYVQIFNEYFPKFTIKNENEFINAFNNDKLEFGSTYYTQKLDEILEKYGYKRDGDSVDRKVIAYDNNFSGLQVCFSWVIDKI